MLSYKREVLRSPVVDRSAWRGSELQNDTSWIYSLPAAAIQDIDVALAQARDLELTLIRRENFPLPSIASELSDILEELNSGRGFAVIRGLPFGKYSDDDIGRIFWGIGTYFGSA